MRLRPAARGAAAFARFFGSRRCGAWTGRFGGIGVRAFFANGPRRMLPKRPRDAVEARNVRLFFAASDLTAADETPYRPSR